MGRRSRILYDKDMILATVIVMMITVVGMTLLLFLLLTIVMCSSQVASLRWGSREDLRALQKDLLGRVWFG